MPSEKTHMPPSTSSHDDPVQPLIKNYPQSSKKRRFNAGYFELFPWIEYSVSQDAVYCFSCRHFQSTSVLSGETLGNIAFIDNGFQKWKDAKALLLKHSLNSRHKTSMEMWVNAKKVSSGEVELVANQIIAQRKEQILENRQHMKYLILAASYLARQGVAFRGNDESTGSSNRGNFFELLELLSVCCPQLKERMETRYGHYACHEYQNDIIMCLAKVVRKNVLSSVGPFWALMVDESKDISKKEQLSFCIRSTTSKGNVFEKPLGVIHMEKVDALSLANGINEAVTLYNLSWNNCVAQCYDGASVMSGPFSGVQARIKQAAPHVTYVHCHSHRLNLILVNIIKFVPEISDLFGKVQAIYVFLSNSSPRHELFIKAQKEDGLSVLELERLVETRWYYWYRSVRKIKLRITTIAVVLESIANQSADSIAALEAKGLLRHLYSTSFLHCLLVVEALLGKINALSEELQSNNINYLAANSLIEQTQADLESMRCQNFWQKIVDEANVIKVKMQQVTSFEFADYSHSKRRQEMSRKLSDYFVLSTVGKKTVDGCEAEAEVEKVTILFQCIDKCLHEMKARFAGNKSLLSNVSLFKPESPTFLSSLCATELLKLYPTCDIDPIVVEAQMQSANSYISSQVPQVVDIHELRTKLSILPRAFSEVIKLIDLVLTLPVTSVENERFFVKSYDKLFIDNKLSVKGFILALKSFCLESS
jgi:hypothetical protein